MVTKIETSISGKSGKESMTGSATGFFYSFNSKIYLITNRHVVSDQKNDSFPDSMLIHIHTDSNNLQKITPHKIDLYDASKNPIWLEHPIYPEIIDVIAIEIPPISNAVIYSFSNSSALPENIILSPNEELILVGYPLGFYDNIYNLPVCRSATIASAYGVPFKGLPCFLVDAYSHPGLSGAPAIRPSKTIQSTTTAAIQISPPTPPYLLGINSGQYRRYGIDLRLNMIWESHLIEEILAKKLIRTQKIPQATLDELGHS
jgi:hypothetical protein